MAEAQSSSYWLVTLWETTLPGGGKKAGSVLEVAVLAGGGNSESDRHWEEA